MHGYLLRCAALLLHVVTFIYHLISHELLRSATFWTSCYNKLSPLLPADTCLRFYHVEGSAFPLRVDFIEYKRKYALPICLHCSLIAIVLNGGRTAGSTAVDRCLQKRSPSGSVSAPHTCLRPSQSFYNARILLNGSKQPQMMFQSTRLLTQCISGGHRTTYGVSTNLSKYGVRRQIDKVADSYQVLPG